jgi:hypothetical protein
MVVVDVLKMMTVMVRSDDGDDGGGNDCDYDNGCGYSGGHEYGDITFLVGARQIERFSSDFCFRS